MWITVQSFVRLSSFSGSAASVSRSPPDQTSYGSHICSSAALWRQVPVPGTVLVWNTPALPGWWPVRPQSPGRLQSCANQPKARRARWMELGGSLFLQLQGRPLLPLLHLFGWRVGWGDYGLSSWPGGRRRRLGRSLSHFLPPPHWNELLRQASLTQTSLQ